MLAANDDIETKFALSADILEPVGYSSSQSTPYTSQANCTNTATGFIKDDDYYGCYRYTMNPDYNCGRYDDTDFKADEMCCACGGGSDHEDGEIILCKDTDNGAVNSDGNGCTFYWYSPY